MAQGDFTSVYRAGDVLGQDALGRDITRGQVFDRTTQREMDGTVIRDPFPNNMIPQTMFDSIASNLISQYPAENQNLTAAGERPGGNFFTTRTATRDVHQFDVRIDHRISDNDSLFGSLSWIDEQKFQSPPLPGHLDAGGFLGETEENLSRAAMMSYTKIWSPNLHHRVPRRLFAPHHDPRPEQRGRRLVRGTGLWRPQPVHHQQWRLDALGTAGL